MQRLRSWFAFGGKTEQAGEEEAKQGAAQQVADTDQFDEFFDCINETEENDEDEFHDAVDELPGQ